MKTKNLAVMLIIIGAIMMLYTGFDYVTTKKVVDLGAVKINKEENHIVRWPPILGAIFLIGGVLLFVVNKNESN